jgi:hypothetical protein
VTFLASNSSSLNDVEPGLLGFLVVAALGVALVFLLRSMNKQFRKIGPPPEDAEDTPAPSADEAPAAENAVGTEEQHVPAGQDAAEKSGGPAAP